MQMHHITGKPDWAEVVDSQRNVWQRTAAATGGLLTPGNTTTLIGFGLAMYALVVLHRRHFWLGLSLLAFARLCDLLDGWVAHRTGTKGPVGEFLDVTADKLITLGCVIIFFTVHTTAWWVLVGLLVPQVVTAGIKLVMAAHKPIRPARSGKLSMALTWVSLLLFLLLQATDRGGILRVCAYLLAAAAVGLGVHANYRYYRAATAK